MSYFKKVKIVTKSLENLGLTNLEENVEPLSMEERDNNIALVVIF